MDHSHLNDIKANFIGRRTTILDTRIMRKFKKYHHGDTRIGKYHRMWHMSMIYTMVFFSSKIFCDGTKKIGMQVDLLKVWQKRQLGCST